MQRKFCLVLTAKTKDVLGTHYASSRVFAASYLKHGFEPVFLDMTHQDDVKQMLPLLQKKPAFIHCEQGHWLNLWISETKQNIFDFFKIPVVAHLRDFPFCPWARESTVQMARGGLLFHTDKEALEIARKMGAPATLQKFAPHVYLDYDYYPENSATPPSGRSQSFAYVGSYRDPEIYLRELQKGYPGRDALFKRCLEAGLSSYRRSIHSVMEECLTGEDINADYKNPEFLDVLFCINQFIRYERRRLLFNKMVRHPVQIVWAGDVPPVEGVIEADIKPRASLKETFALMERSRAMIMTLNNFSYSLSERLLTAMHRNCVVISQSNAMIDEAFADNQDIMLLDDTLENFDDVLERAGDDTLADRIAEKAFDSVRVTYSPETRVNEFLQALNLKT